MEEVNEFLDLIWENGEDCLNVLAEEIAEADLPDARKVEHLERLIERAENAIYTQEDDLRDAYHELLGTCTSEAGSVAVDYAEVLKESDPIAYEMGFRDFCEGVVDDMHPCLSKGIRGWYEWE